MKIVTVVVVFVVMVFIGGRANAQAGSLDPTFGNGGIVITDFGTPYDWGQSVAIQSDGKIVVGGSTGYPTADFALARYNTDGNLDTAFGSDGKVITDFVGSEDRGIALAIQSDSKIVLAGYHSDGRIELARYKTNGSLDSSFDADGKVLMSGLGYDFVTSIAIYANGKIVVGGRVGTVFCSVRFNSNGSLDNTFDLDGIVLTSIGSDAGEFSLAIQSDDKLVVAGYSSTFNHYDFALVRYNYDGSLDTTFNNNGKVTTDFGNTNDYGRALAIQGDGKIVAIGDTRDDSTYDVFAVARYKTDGSLDSSFGTNGEVTTYFDDGYELPETVAIQSDGKIVVAGETWDNYVNYYTYSVFFALVRYNSDGTLDTTFGTNGIVITSVGGYDDDFCQSVALQSDGKIVAAGFAGNFYGRDFAVVRYNSDYPTGISNNYNEQETIILSPNPFTTYLQLHYTLNQPGELMVYDALGRKIKSYTLAASQKTFELSMAEFPAGVYLVAVNSGGQAFGEMVVKE